MCCRTGYEIFSQVPYQIRKTETGRIITEGLNPDGYIQVGLGGTTSGKHTVIARQFIPNPTPETFTDIDHINHVSNDNRLENLRWVTKSHNARNESSHKGVVYEYVDKLPQDAHQIEIYSTYHFADHWYSPTTTLFYYHGVVTIRVLHVCQTSR